MHKFYVYCRLNSFIIEILFNHLQSADVAINKRLWLLGMYQSCNFVNVHKIL